MRMYTPSDGDTLETSLPKLSDTFPGEKPCGFYGSGDLSCLGGGKYLVFYLIFGLTRSEPSPRACVTLTLCSGRILISILIPFCLIPRGPPFERPFYLNTGWQITHLFFILFSSRTRAKHYARCATHQSSMHRLLPADIYVV